MSTHVYLKLLISRRVSLWSWCVLPPLPPSVRQIMTFWFNAPLCCELIDFKPCFYASHFFLFIPPPIWIDQGWISLVESSAEESPECDLHHDQNINIIIALFSLNYYVFLQLHLHIKNIRNDPSVVFHPSARTAGDYLAAVQTLIRRLWQQINRSIDLQPKNISSDWRKPFRVRNLSSWRKVVRVTKEISPSWASETISGGLRIVLNSWNDFCFSRGAQWCSRLVSEMF